MVRKLNFITLLILLNKYINLREFQSETQQLFLIGKTDFKVYIKDDYHYQRTAEKKTIMIYQLLENIMAN